jgi:YggT family protein
MDVILYPLLKILLLLIEVYRWALVVYVIIHLLVTFNLLNKGNQFIDSVYSFLHKIIDPAASRIRKVIPVIGGMDFSILGLFLLIYFVQEMLTRILVKYFMQDVMIKTLLS